MGDGTRAITPQWKQLCAGYMFPVLPGSHGQNLFQHLSICLASKMPIVDLYLISMIHANALL